MKISVSVIVTIFNLNDYIKTCINSIVNQTLREIEIILVDDGSTDGSAEICDELVKESRTKSDIKRLFIVFKR